MINITLTEQIIQFDKIIGKSINELTFKESISLIFHAIKNLSDDQTRDDHMEWRNIYQEFLALFEEQNKTGWPQLIISRNDYDKRMDISSLSTPFLKANNLLIMLIRLIYVENYKRSYVYKTYRYHKVLGYKNNSLSKMEIKNASLSDLLLCLRDGLEHYLKIYYDKNQFEYQLVKNILSQII